MRTIPVAMQGEVSAPLGSEPLVLVEIDWTTGTGYYADREITIGAQAYLPRIVSIDDVTTVARRDTLGTLGISSVTLSDIAGDLKALLDDSIVEGRAVRVYHAYEGTSLLIMDGVIAGSITWSDGSKTLTLGVETPIHSDVFGYEDWPIVFGDCIRVPAKEYQAHQEGELIQDLVLTAASTTGTFRVVGGRDFPQSTPVKIALANRSYFHTGPGKVNGVWAGRYPSTSHWFMDGSFDGEVFTATRLIASKYDSPIALDVPDTTDPDWSTDRVRVAWLKNDERIEGLYIRLPATTVGHQDRVNYCIRQEGKKCWFYQPWYDVNTESYLPSALFTDGTSFNEACIIAPPSWGAAKFYHLSPVPIITGFPYPIDFEIRPFVQWEGAHTYAAGTKVIEWDADLTPTWIANLYPSTEVVEVMAYRRVLEDDKQSTLVPVPSSYYTINLSGSISGHTPTVITMPGKLSDRHREGWEDQIYVSLRSTLSKNTATAVKHLLDGYTDLGTDTPSFTEVAGHIENYPSNFVLYGEQDVLQTVQRMAYQARCVLLQTGSNIGIRYLSLEVSASRTYSESDLIFRSLEQSFTPTNDIRTKHEITWTRDHSLDDPEEFSYILNEDIFGTQEESTEWLIYNIKELVEKSAAFWGYRKANSWRFASFQTVYTALDVEGYDTNAIDVAAFAANSIRGVVEDLAVSYDQDTIAVSLHLAAKAGSLSEDTNFWTGDPSYLISPMDTMPEDPLIDRQLVDYVPGQWPVEVPEEDLGLNVMFTRSPESMKRAVADEFQVMLFDNDGNRYPGRYTLQLRINSTSVDDALSITEVELDNDGIWTGNLTITGGSGPAVCTISILTLRNPWDNAVLVEGTTGEQIGIDPSGEVIFSVLPDFAIRDGAFEVALIHGTASGTVGVAIQVGDTDDVIYDADTDTPLTTLTLDAEGNYSGSWYITGGATNPAATQIRLTETGWEHDSKIITLTGPYIVRNVDDEWVIGVDDYEVLQLRNGSSVHFMNYVGGLPDAATDGAGTYWRYNDATGVVGWFIAFGAIYFGEDSGVAAIDYQPNPDENERVLSLMNTVVIHNEAVVFYGASYKFSSSFPTTDPEEGLRIWNNNGFLSFSGAAELSDLAFSGSWIDIVDAPYGIGEIWAEGITGDISVEQPAAPILHEGRYYSTALYFGVATGGGIDLGMTRNVHPDPVDKGEVNLDDIEITFRLANAPQGTVKGRALGTGEGVPINLSPAQVAAIVEEGGGGGGGDVEEAPSNNETYGRRNAAWQALATVATSGSYASLSNIPATFAPSQHALFGGSHSGFTLTELAEGHGLAYDGATWVNRPVLQRIDGAWTISGSADALEMLLGSDIIFRNRSGSTVSAASEASAIGWAYSATRYVGLGYYGGNVALIDGTYTGGPDGSDPITYKPNATDNSRELEFDVKTLRIKGSTSDIVIDKTLLNTAGKAMSIREIDVCVDGYAKKMLVLASLPY